MSSTKVKHNISVFTIKKVELRKEIWLNTISIIVSADLCDFVITIRKKYLISPKQRLYTQKHHMESCIYCKKMFNLTSRFYYNVQLTLFYIFAFILQ